MPRRFAVAEVADRLVVLDHVGNDVDVRKRLVEYLAVGIGPGRIELAEVSAERQELWIGKLLTAHDYDKPIAPRLLDGVHFVARQRLCQVDAAHLGTEWRVQVSDR